MPINPNIALSVRGIELQNPLDQYSKVMALQNAQQQNALAQQQMQEYSRTREEEQGIRNRLAGGASLEDAETRNFLLSSKSGRDILQRQSELQKSETEEATRRAKLMADTENMYRNMSGQIGNKADATAFLLRMVNDPALKGSPIASIPIMQQVQRIPDDPQGLDNWIKQFALGTTKYVTENKPVTSVGPTGVVQTPGLGIGDARVVPGTSAAFQMTPAQIAANKIAQGQLAVSQGQLGVAQQRLAQDAQNVSIQQDAQGNLIAVPTRLAAGAMPTARPVTGEGGAPVKGKLSAFAEKSAAQRGQMGKDLDFAIRELGTITKDGGLIDQSTGSGAGRLVDIGAGFVGQATPGAIAIGKIAPVADLALKMVPRFEGPQSDKDTASYKEAAGQLADPTLPTEIRKQAGRTVLRLMRDRKNQFVTNDMAAEGAGPAAGAPDPLGIR